MVSSRGLLDRNLTNLIIPKEEIPLITYLPPCPRGLYARKEVALALSSRAATHVLILGEKFAKHCVNLVSNFHIVKLVVTVM